MARTPKPDLPLSNLDLNFRADVDSIVVLHVDDEPDFAEMVATFLERESPDIEVLTETDVDGALDRLGDGGETHADCIVSDYQMPGRNGIEFLEVVRETHPDLPFILFTGKGSEEVAGRAISAGVTDYLQKESGIDQYTVLANRIQNAVAKTRSERTVAELLSAIETAREGISLLDEDGRFVYVNESYADTYGYRPEELLGERWHLLYPEDTVDRVREEILPSVPDEGTWRGETRMVRADGTEIITDHALSYTPAGLMVCNIDVVSSDADHESSLHKDAIDALDDLLFFFAEDGTLQYWNEAVSSVTGYTDDELASLTPADFVHEDDREKVRTYVRATRETGEARIEVRLRRADGETIPYEFISKHVTNDWGAVVGRIGLGRDISARKRYELEIERKNDRLEHFAETLSHDLRNPLTVAKGRLELFNETGDEKHYETAKAALDRMDSLVTDVLTLAQSGESISLTEYDAVELASVAEDAWALLQTEDATLRIEGTGTVEADVSRLQQVLENLFRNAMEHGPDDVSVRVGVLADGTGLYVADDGPGISPDEREVVFEAGHSTKDEGTGFGLATIEQIVEAHDWRVRITDSESSGARFEITGLDVR